MVGMGCAWLKIVGKCGTMALMGRVISARMPWSCGGNLCDFNQIRNINIFHIIIIWYICSMTDSIKNIKNGAIWAR